MKLNPYLNFDGNAKEAFEFYQSVFGGELSMQKMKEVPGSENFADDEKEMMMHICLPIGDGQLLMACDCLKSQGHVCKPGNTNYISISPDSRDEATRIFNELSIDGEIEMPMEDMFWGDYFGSFIDKYKICWMVNYNENYK